VIVRDLVRVVTRQARDGVQVSPGPSRGYYRSGRTSISPIDISLIMIYIDAMKTLKKKPIQMYIEPGQDAALAVLARKRGVSKTELIRESIQKYLTALPVEEDPAMGLVGLGSSGKGDISEQHDKYIVKYAKVGRTHDVQ